MKNFFKEKSVYLVGIALLIITALVILTQINKGDESIFFSQHRSDFASLYLRFATHIGEPYVYIAAAGIFLFFRYRYSVSVVIVMGLVGIFAATLKWLFAHPRPYTYFNEVLHQPEAINLVLPLERMNVGWTSSFPSGHTTSAFAFYGFLALISPNHWLRVICLFLACSVAVSRMYLIQHFLEDITAGMVTGTLVAFMVYAMQPYLDKTSWGNKSLRRTGAPAA